MKIRRKEINWKLEKDSVVEMHRIQEILILSVHLTAFGFLDLGLESQSQNPMFAPF